MTEKSHNNGGQKFFDVLVKRMEPDEADARSLGYIAGASRKEVLDELGKMLDESHAFKVARQSEFFLVSGIWLNIRMFRPKSPLPKQFSFEEARETILAMTSSEGRIL